MSKVRRVTDGLFAREVLEAELPVLVDFWASWCPPCKMVEPVMEELAGECEGMIKVAAVNVDQNSTVAARYRIAGVPTFILFERGAEVARFTGAQPKDRLRDALRDAFSVSL